MTKTWNARSYASPHVSKHNPPKQWIGKAMTGPHSTSPLPKKRPDAEIIEAWLKSHR